MPPKTTFWGWRSDLRDPQIKDISQVIIITILPAILVKLLPVGWGNRQKLFGESIFPCHSCPAMFCGIYDFGSIMINESFFSLKLISGCQKAAIFVNIWFCLVALCYRTWGKVSITGNNLNILLDNMAVFMESCYHWHSQHGQCVMTCGHVISCPTCCLCSEWRNVIGRCYSCSGCTNLENIR